MGIEDAVIAQQVMLQQNIAMAVLKQSAQQQQQIAAVLADSAGMVPVSSSQGALVNIAA